MEDRLAKIQVYASLSDSEPYVRVNEIHVGFDPKTGKFVIITASWNFDWGGEPDESQFDSWDELVESLKDYIDHHYGFSEVDMQAILAEASAGRDVTAKQVTLAERSEV